MSLKERRLLEEIEGDSLLNKPQWFIKEKEVEVETVKATDKAEDIKTKL